MISYNQIITERGFTFVERGETTLFYKGGFSDAEIEMEFQPKDFGTEVSYNIYARRGWNSLNDIINNIFVDELKYSLNNQKKVFQLFQISKSICNAELESLITNVIDWGVKADKEKDLYHFAENPGHNYYSQLRHLASLAYFGKWELLDDYQSALDSNKSHYHLPFGFEKEITLEVVKRALSIAYDKAFS